MGHNILFDFLNADYFVHLNKYINKHKYTEHRRSENTAVRDSQRAAVTHVTTGRTINISLVSNQSRLIRLVANI